MEPKGSLPHLQVPANCPCPEPDQTRPWPPSQFLKIYLNIILPSKRGSSMWSLFLRFPHQNPAYTSPLPYPCYMFISLILLDLITRTKLGEERSLSSSLCNVLHSPVTSSLLDPNILLSTLLPHILTLRSSLNVCDQVLHPYTTVKIIVLYI